MSQSGMVMCRQRDMKDYDKRFYSGDQFCRRTLGHTDKLQKEQNRYEGTGFFN